MGIEDLSLEKLAERPELEPNQSLWLMLIVAAAVLIAPIWLTSAQPVQDAPSHIAELYIVTNAEYASARSPYYQVEWALVPDLASEILVPPLARLISLAPAIKVFLSVGILFWIFGLALIQRALFGRLYSTSLIAALFAYNGNFVLGFWNFYFGLGLGLVFFALWIGWSRRPNAWKTAFFAAVTVALYFCHLLAAIAFMVLVVGYEGTLALGDAHPWTAARRSCVRLVLICLPAAIFFCFRPHAVGSGGPIDWSLVQSIPSRAGAILRTSRNGTQWQIVLSLMLLAALGLGSRRMAIHPAMRPLLLVVALICALAPVGVGGGAYLHERFPGMLFGLFFAACAVKLGSASRVALTGAATGLLLIIGVQALIESQNYNDQIREYRDALREIPKGSKIFPAMDVPKAGSLAASVYFHIDSYIVTDRGGFASLLFTTRGQHIVHTKPQYDAIAALSSDEGVPPALSELPALRFPTTNDSSLFRYHRNILNWPCRFDAVVVIEPQSGHRASLAEFKLVRSGSFFSLYQIRKPAQCLGTT